MAATAAVEGNLEVVHQCLEFLSTITEDQYCFVNPAVAGSTIGTHFRHILDMYRALKTPLIDYDVRRREAQCEVDCTLAQSEFYEIRQWLKELNHESLLVPVVVRTEVTLNQTNSVELPSTLLRELVFVSSHTVHHLALIAILARNQGVDVDDLLGVAPATVTFLKLQLPF